MLMYKHNPQLITSTVNHIGKTINVIREDYLPCGTKQRGYLFFKELSKTHDGIILVAASNGYGQIAASWCANRVGIECHIVYNTSIVSDDLVRRSHDYGAKCYTAINDGEATTVREIYDGKTTFSFAFDSDKNISTKISDEASRELLQLLNNKGMNPKLIDLGLNDPGYINELSRCIDIANVNNIYPRRLWLTVGSGTIVSSLVKIWPKTVYLIVQVGMRVDADKYGVKYELYRYPNGFINSVLEKDKPPYPSVDSYDAKLWKFVKIHGQTGDYIWNTAANEPTIL